LWFNSIAKNEGIGLGGSDIPLPNGIVPPGEENEEDIVLGANKPPEKWLDLGLQTLR
jgi:hypothetical protein